MKNYHTSLRGGTLYQLVTSSGRKIEFGILNSGRRVDPLVLIELDAWAKDILGMSRGMYPRKLRMPVEWVKQ